MPLPKVTFGFVNCNRLYYLKSTIDSFLESTDDYANLDLIVVDNASTEVGTDEYLEFLKKEHNFRVFKTDERDPSNEYARALNTIISESKGKFVAPIAADMQFVLMGRWLHEYVRFFEENIEHIGCIGFDAQRNITNSKHNFSEPMHHDPQGVEGYYRFVYNYSKLPIAPSCNVFFLKETLEKIYPWDTDSGGHEGADSAESKMLTKIQDISNSKENDWKFVMPIIPPSVLIYNQIGDSAKIRGNKRYGYYYPPIESYKYYNTFQCQDLISMTEKHNIPIGIEVMAQAVGWDAPIDENGRWIKHSVDINTCEVCEEV